MPRIRRATARHASAPLEAFRASPEGPQVSVILVVFISRSLTFRSSLPRTYVRRIYCLSHGSLLSDVCHVFILSLYYAYLVRVFCLYKTT